MEENRKQLNFWIPLEWHNEIKIKAIEKNTTVKKWILQAIIEQIKREKND